MAYGSMQQMRSYSAKVFDKDARPSRVTDVRVDPKIPLGAVLSTWHWGLTRRIPSAERIGDLLLDPRWRARVGLKREDVQDGASLSVLTSVRRGREGALFCGRQEEKAGPRPATVRASNGIRYTSILGL